MYLMNFLKCSNFTKNNAENHHIVVNTPLGYWPEHSLFETQEQHT